MTKNILVLFEFVILLGSLVILIILGQTQSITGYVSHTPVENYSKAINIDLIFPIRNAVIDKLDSFVFYVEETCQCNLKTNYSGTWTNYPSSDIIVFQGEKVIPANFDISGIYAWNLECHKFNGNSTTWGSNNDIFFTITGVNNNTINNTNLENETNNNTLENNSLNPQMNISNETINNTQILINLSTNQTELNNTGNNLSDNDSVNITNDVVCYGCLANETCYYIGTINEKTNQYCAKMNEFRNLKNAKETCDHDFECATQFCLKNICRKNNSWTKLLNLFGFI